MQFRVASRRATSLPPRLALTWPSLGPGLCLGPASVSLGPPLGPLLGPIDGPPPLGLVLAFLGPRLRLPWPSGQAAGRGASATGDSLVLARLIPRAARPLPASSTRCSPHIGHPDAGAPPQPGSRQHPPQPGSRQHLWGATPRCPTSDQTWSTHCGASGPILVYVALRRTRQHRFIPDQESAAFGRHRSVLARCSSNSVGSGQLGPELQEIRRNVDGIWTADKRDFLQACFGLWFLQQSWNIVEA